MCVGVERIGFCDVELNSITQAISIEVLVIVADAIVVRIGVKRVCAKDKNLIPILHSISISIWPARMRSIDIQLFIVRETIKV